jgi:uncharacterized protein Yka (UPF0111/DUF47 family)
MYQNEKEMDPITIMFLDKYTVALGKIANAAEKAAKYLRQMIGS